MSEPITIRHSTGTDRVAVEELADLDERPAPVGQRVRPEPALIARRSMRGPSA